VTQEARPVAGPARQFTVHVKDGTVLGIRDWHDPELQARFLAADYAHLEPVREIRPA